jgi:hypothetical protein
MAEGHLCITYGRILDAEVAFGHDKSFKNDTFHFYEKALPETRNQKPETPISFTFAALSFAIK